MQILRKILIRTALAMAILLLAGVWLAFFLLDRHSLPTPQLLRDGSSLNYCNYGTRWQGQKGRRHCQGQYPDAATITSPCNLRECGTTCAKRRHKGLWRGISGKVGHVEQVEQWLGVVVTSSSLILTLVPTTPVVTTVTTPGIKWYLPLVKGNIAHALLQACSGMTAY